MIKPKTNQNQLTFCSTFEEVLDKKHPLCVLANKINWKFFEDEFSKHYHKTMGRPAKPIRMMVGLLILKHLRNLSDESVVEQCGENSYYQYFCGLEKFVSRPPCDASEFVHFRNRIGKGGMEIILQESIRVASEIISSRKKTKSNNKNDSGNNKNKIGKNAILEKDVIIDTTVQEKNITYPTDDKLYKKIIKKCVEISEREAVELRQNYRRTVKKLSYQQRFKKSKKQRKLAIKASRRIKTIAGRLLRDLERKLNPGQKQKYELDIELFKKVLNQKREDKNKIYSLHEPQTECISKGKEHKKYEFGKKVSIVIGKKTGIIMGALTMEKNDYDGHTLPEVLGQFEKINSYRPKRALVDLGYKGTDKVEDTIIVRPESGKGKSKYARRKMRMDHRRRAGIEGKISHLKNDYRMGRNYYKGIKGDSMNVLLASASMNFKLWMNNYKRKLKYFCLNLLIMIKAIFERLISKPEGELTPKMTF
jgi:IS5 family transposase